MAHETLHTWATRVGLSTKPAIRSVRAGEPRPLPLRAEALIVAVAGTAGLTVGFVWLFSGYFLR